MKKFFTTACFAALISAASLANAALIGSAVQVPINSPPEVTGVPGYVAYQLSVATDDGSSISAVDVFIGGDLHQAWSDTNFDFVADPTPVGPPANGRGDSHLTPVQGALVGSAYTEDSDGTTSPLIDLGAGRDYGQGNFLRGAWGIPGASQTDNTPIAYIVIPEGSEFSTEVRIDVAGSAGGGALTSADFFPQIPEPTTAVLALFGALGLACGSRKRN